jgi:hypothetical protein
MITGLTLALLLTAAPRGLADAELITWAPKASEVSTLLPFFSRAGQGSVMVAPASWRESAHPLLVVDVTRPESMTAAGISVADGLTVTVRGPITVGCHTLSDARAFEAAARARLERYGTVFRTEAAGLITLGSRDALNRVQAAALIKGKESCSVSASGQTVEKLLPEVTKAFAKPLAGAWVKAATDQPATQYFMVPERPQDPAARLKGWATLALSSKGDTLTVDGRTKGLPISTLQPSGASPFAQLSAPGVMTVRARVAKEQLGPVMEQLFSGLPGGRTLAPAAKELAPSLTGNVAFVFSRVKVTSGLRAPASRFFAMRFVLLAEASDAAAAKAVVDAVDQKALQFKEGRLEAGVVGNVVWLSDEGEARDAVLAALGRAAGQQKHGAEFDVDPQALAKALASVPLLEIVQSPELSGVLVAATEVGPLLMMTDRVRGWLDSTSASTDRKSTRLNSSHNPASRMPSSA